MPIHLVGNGHQTVRVKKNEFHEAEIDELLAPQDASVSSFLDTSFLTKKSQKRVSYKSIH